MLKELTESNWRPFEGVEFAEMVRRLLMSDKISSLLRRHFERRVCPNRTKNIRSPTMGVGEER